MKDVKRAEENLRIFDGRRRLKAAERAHFKKGVEETANRLDGDFAENAIASPKFDGGSFNCAGIESCS